MTSSSTWTIVGVPLIASSLERKNEREKVWDKGYYVVKNSNLYCFETKNSKTPHLEFPLYGSILREEPDNEEKKYVFYIVPSEIKDRGNSRLLLNAKSKIHLDRWLKVLKKESKRKPYTSVFGSPLGYGQSLRTDEGSYGLLPLILKETIAFLVSHEEILQKEGLFDEENFNMDRVNELAEMGSSGKSLESTFNSEKNPFCVSGLLLKYLKDLPEPILTYDLFFDFKRALTCPYKYKSSLVLRSVINRLPPINYEVIKYLTQFFLALSSNSAQNKMNVSSIARVFGPTVLARESGDIFKNSEDFYLQCEILTLLLDKFSVIFSEDIMSKMEPYRKEISSQFFVKAICDYTGQTEKQLSFVKGDIIMVLTTEKSGWWAGRLNEKIGIFPSSYTKVYSPKNREITTLALGDLIPNEISIGEIRKMNVQLIEDLKTFKQKSGFLARNALENLLEKLIDQLKMLKLQVAMEATERMELEKLLQKKKNN
ncbi:rho gtpase-activating protein 68f [Anaeramoeba flamelloides]|uniref:Rho gtpase-activating protein 68f n=1 Tax=Anaeramoeba flamelloides TaxID=1746091 RepID=A0ABQ8X9M6_9EUKA|nr:rho gtpase-activating protein 68f [Anaeramoeba flamelloides]KAJ6229297.1 rho gtpase-activating protein 68f [Anaeramoeba flamelloides]